MVLGLQDEIRRSEASRYDHRLHGVLLVAQGMTCPEVAKLLGDAPRTVEYWVRGFEQEGLAGLREGERGGRPRRLSEKQLQQVNAALRQMPRRWGWAAICGTEKPWPPGCTPVWDQLGSAPRSAFVPAVGFSLAQTAPRHCLGRPGTAAGT